MPKNEHTKQPKERLQIKRAGWQRECSRYGLAGDTAIAAHMGLAMPTYYRVRTGQAQPGPTFILAALRSFPLARFEELFEGVTTTTTRRAA